jgi:hypothetical protein
MRTTRSFLGLAFLFSTIVAVGCTTVDDGDGCPASCRPAACSDGKRSPAENETGVDCGGVCGACDGEACTTKADCARGTCEAGKCAPPATKTCGLGRPTKCENATKCQQDIDCTSDYCDGTCIVPPPNVHEDGRRNGGETGKDCGGTAVGKPCPAGETCVSDNDCESRCVNGTCTPPTATDGKKNQGESDIDCGGPNAPKCVRGKTCIANDDCQLLYCANARCETPSDKDLVKNGGESDVDCGGPGVTEGAFSYLPPRCNELKKCAADPDCKTGACSPAGICVPRSCDSNETAGLTTCGVKEVGDPGAVHESCCRSLKLPTRNMRLDKYEITAGRFRTFLTVVGPNVRAWVQGYVTANPTSQLGKMIGSYPNVVDVYPATKKGNLGLVGHMALDFDTGGGNRGCYNGLGSYAHNTYWQDADDLTEYALPPRTLAREDSDAKSLNCAMPIMFAAFCAWDGGALATRDELLDAWGPGPFPWGDTPVPETTDTPPKPTSTNYNWCNGEFGTGTFKCQNSALGANGIFYRFPLGTNLANDMGPLIASPGRFPLDATALKGDGESWADLFGNMSEYTGDFSGTDTFCDLSAPPGPGQPSCTRTEEGPPEVVRTGTPHTNIPRVGYLGRSWEGHFYDRGYLDVWPSTGQYGKFGGRCVRPLE